jgi:hypothetical protein
VQAHAFLLPPSLRLDTSKNPLLGLIEEAIRSLKR